MSQPSAPDFRTRVQERLARYKRDTLGVVEDGVSGKKQKRYPHVLPEGRQRLNIVAGIRDEFWITQEREGWPLHHHFTHLSSSQALAFNLFHPLFAKWSETVGPYLTGLGLNKRPLKRSAVQLVLDATEGTTVDAVLEFIDGSRCLIEVKFAEPEFGTAPNDQAHRERLTQIYLPKLAGQVHADALQADHFFRNYQLFRNLSLLRPGSADRLVLLLPRANAVLWAAAEQWTADPQLGTFAGQVTLVALEDLLGVLAAPTGAKRMVSHANEMIAKYAPAESTAA